MNPFSATLQPSRAAALALIAILPAGAAGQAAGPSTASPAIDAAYTQQIRQATTDPRFLTPWVDSLVTHPNVPDPRRYLGYIAGSPGMVSDVEQIHGYFRALARSSSRARLFSFGMSDAGREGLVLAIADEQTVAQLDLYKEYLRALADPRRTDSSAATKLITQAKPIYWVTAGLHSEELGAPEMTMELAYRLLVEEREPFTSIRNRVITLITPILEVDGRERQIEWTRRYAPGHLSEFDRPPTSPPYWGKYVYHDNNRDSIGVSQTISRNYFDVYFDWLPTLTLDLHESIPYLYVFGGTGPYNEGLDATTTAEWQMLANYEVSRLTGFGLPGVWTWAYTDGWYPGFLLSVTNNHNASGRFFETFGNYSPETMLRDIGDKVYAGQPATSRQWYRPSAPDKSTLWSMRDNVNYTQSGVIASLEAVANNPTLFLESYYARGVSAVRKGEERAPYAFIIPRRQRDKAAAADLIDLLRRQRIEMGVMTHEAAYGGTPISTGDVLIKLNQPYGPLAKNLLEPQVFPVNAAVPPPYDDVAWTLGLLFGVATRPIDDRAALSWVTSPLTSHTEPFEISVPDSADVWAVSHQAQESLGPFCFALARTRIYAAKQPFEAGGSQFPSGSLLLRNSDLRGIDVRALLRRYKLDAVALSAMPNVVRHEIRLPRIAVLQSWTDTQNSGWVRFVLDQAHVPYELIDKERLHGAPLRKAYDVVLVPAFSAKTTAAQLIHGFSSRWGRLPYEKTASTPELGAILSSPDISGGFGFDGMQALQRFATEGGTLITLASAGVLVAETGLSELISADRPPGMNTPGSVIATEVLARSSPLVYGYDRMSYAFHGNGPLYKVTSQHRENIIMRFGTGATGTATAGSAASSAVASASTAVSSDTQSGGANTQTALVLSGGIVAGQNALEGSPALLVEPLGKGTLVVFGWNPLHRGLNRHDYAFLYNALLNWNDLTTSRSER